MVIGTVAWFFFYQRSVLRLGNKTGSRSDIQTVGSDMGSTLTAERRCVKVIVYNMVSRRNLTYVIAVTNISRSGSTIGDKNAI